MYALCSSNECVYFQQPCFQQLCFQQLSCFQLSVCECVCAWPGRKLTLIGHLGLPLLIWWVDTLTYLSRE
jgi:hypothetical protein